MLNGKAYRHVNIYLVRHGETEWNLTGRFQGRLNSALTAAGREQTIVVAKTLAEHLRGEWDLPMHVSPLGRSLDTATILRERVRTTQVQVEARIREISMGSWDGLTQEEILERFPGVLEGSTPNNWYFRAPDGERYEQLRARVQSWLRDLRGPTIVVSHGITTRVIRGLCLGLPDEETIDLPIPQTGFWRIIGDTVTFVKSI